MIEFIPNCLPYHMSLKLILKTFGAEISLFLDIFIFSAFLNRVRDRHYEWDESSENDDWEWVDEDNGDEDLDGTEEEEDGT